MTRNAGRGAHNLFEPGKANRGLPGPQRRLTVEEKQWVEELNNEIEEIQQALHGARGSIDIESFQHVKTSELNLKKDIGDQLKHRLEFLHDERNSVLDATKQETNKPPSNNRTRRDRNREARRNSQQRRVEQQTGIENHTNMPNIGRL